MPFRSGHAGPRILVVPQRVRRHVRVSARWSATRFALAGVTMYRPTVASRIPLPGQLAKGERVLVPRVNDGHAKSESIGESQIMELGCTLKRTLSAPAYKAAKVQSL